MPSVEEKPWAADAVERWPTAKLVPYAKNARTHSPAQVDQIAASVREWGWTTPVLAGEDGTIICGHGRVLAAQKLGLASLPVMVARGWTEAQKRAYILADNKLALNAGWDTDLLRLELGSLKDEGFSLELTGFGDDELKALFSALEPNKGLTDPDEVPEAPLSPVSAPGDLWVMGRHRLLCGDSTILGCVERLTAGRPMDTIITDPPYSSGGRQDGGKRHSSSIGSRGAETIARDNLTTKGYLALMSMVLTNIDAETAYVFTDWRMWTWTYDALEAAGYPVRNMLVWDKERMGMGFPWRAQHELVAYAKRTGAKMGDGKKGNVLKCPRTRNELHPTQKPAALVEEVMANDPGANVYEPFNGSGTTLIAAETVGKNCFATEINPAYVDVAVKRWQAFTGKAATLESDGRTFAEAEARKAPEAAQAAE